MADTSRHDTHEQQDSSRGDSPPEVYLLVLLGIAGSHFTLRYLGDRYAWYWSALILVAGVGLLLVWGRFISTPRRQRKAARQRDLAAIDEEIAKHGMSAERRQRRLDLEEHHRTLADETHEAETYRGWRDKPVSWPRSVVRWVSLGLLIAFMIPMGLIFYGSLFLLPPGVMFAVAYLFIGVWAFIPAALALPAGGWLVWWWVNRVPASSAQAAGMAGAGGA